MKYVNKPKKKNIWEKGITDRMRGHYITYNETCKIWKAYHNWDIKESYIRKDKVKKLIKSIQAWWRINKCKQEASFDCNGERCEKTVYLKEPNFVKLTKKEKENALYE